MLEILCTSYIARHPLGGICMMTLLEHKWQYRSDCRRSFRSPDRLQRGTKGSTEGDTPASIRKRGIVTFLVCGAARAVDCARTRALS